MSCFRATVASVSSFGADAPAAPHPRPFTVSQSWWPRTLHRRTEYLQRTSTAGCLARSFLAAALSPSVPVIIELTNFSENLGEHERGHWLHRQDVELSTYAVCAYGGPRPVPVVMLDLNVSGNLPNNACDGGYRHIPHHVWLSSTRLCGTGHTGAQTFPARHRCKNSGQILLSSVSMWETQTCRIWGVSCLFCACCSCNQERTSFHRCCPKRRDRTNM